MIKNFDEWKIIEVMSKKVYDFGKWVPNDVSFYEISDGENLAICVDTLVDKTDIPPKMSYVQAGRKAAVSVVSDLASKGVKPLGMVFSISIPRKFSLRSVEEVALGLKIASEEHSFKILGGDTNEANNLSITCCGFGLTKFKLGRNGARPGDIVYVTGLFGLQSLGLKLLLNGIEPENDIEREAVNLALEPKARLKEGIMAVSTGAVTASIDSSDGLSISLHQIAEASRVKILVTDPPIHPKLFEEAEKFGFKWEELVYGGGEEFELIFTVKRELEGKFRKAFKNEGLNVFRIGEVREGRGVYLIKGEKEVELKKIGWRHFKLAK